MSKREDLTLGYTLAFGTNNRGVRMVRPSVALLIFILSSPLFAATIPIKIFVDRDNDRFTGCSSIQFTGAELLIVTSVDDGTVTSVTRQTCVSGVFDAPQQESAGGWKVAPPVIETSFSLQQWTPPIHLGFAIGNGPVIDGLFPPSIPMRRRAVDPSPDDRQIVLDGNADDWAGIEPFLTGNGAIRNVYAFTSGSQFFVRLDSSLQLTPIAIADSFNVAQGRSVTIAARGVLANDSDPQGLRLTAHIAGNPSHGSVSLQESGGFTYNHNGDASTTDIFRYIASNGTATSAAATVTMNVQFNAPPTAANDGYTVAEGGTLNVAAPGLFTNDSDPDTPSSSWTISVITPPLNGTLSIGAGGAFVYAHNGSETTSDSFVYRISDGFSTANATVSITITPVDDPPIVVSDTYVTNEDTPLSVAAPGVLANDSDPDSALTAVLTTTTPNGTLTLNANGSFNYTPNGDFFGDDTFTYNATGTVTIHVNAVNDPPSFTSGGNVTVLEDPGAYSAPWATAVSAGPANESAQPRTFSVTNDNNPLFSAQPAISSTGVLTFTPFANANGFATVTVSLSDGIVSTTPLTFIITVSPVNDPPTFTIPAPNQVVGLFTEPQTVPNFVQSIGPGGGADEIAQTVSFSATPSGSTGTIAFTGPPAVDAAGTLTYAVMPGTSGTATFALAGTDTGVPPTTTTQTFTITAEGPPAVASTTPTEGQTGVSRSAPITIVFNEPVNATLSSFTLNCGVGTPTFTLSASPATTFTLTPTSQLPAAICSVNVLAAQISDVDTVDPPDNPIADYPLTFDTNTPPVANPDSYSAFGNVTLSIAAPGVLTNDVDPDTGQTRTVTTTVATGSAGGTFTFLPNGSFTYLSPAGATTIADTVTYAMSDGVATSSASLSINIGTRYWYVRHDATAPGDGRDTSPFTSLANAVTTASDGETIFVLAGGAGVLNESAGVNLKPSQSIIGQGIAAPITAVLNSNTVTLLASGTAPTITGAPTSSTGTLLMLSTNNTLRGVHLECTLGAAIWSGATGGTFTASEVSINTTNAQALGLAGGNFAATFTSINTTGSRSIDLNDTTGSITVNGGTLASQSGSNLTITGGSVNFSCAANVSGAMSGNAIIEIRSITGGTIVFSGTLTTTNTNGIRIDGNTGGTITFSGPAQTFTGSLGDGVVISNNPGTSVAFTGGNLDVTNDAGTLFSASDTGTVTVTGTSNTLTKTAGGGGNPFSLLSIDVGTAGIQFQSISADGPGTAISIGSVTGSGGVSVLGDGVTAGSGGVIQNVSSTAIDLTFNTAPITLNYLTITSGGGVQALNNTTVTMTGGSLSTNGDALRVENGALNATFTSVSETAAFGRAVQLIDVTGSLVVNGGNIVGVPEGVIIEGGSIDVTWRGSINALGWLVSVGNNHSGTVTFETGTLTNSGTGIRFFRALGTYRFLGTTTLSGGDAGIDITDGSNGTFVFGTGASITNPSGIAFEINSSHPSLTYSGNMTQANNAALIYILSNIGPGAPPASVLFQTGTLTATNGIGIQTSSTPFPITFSGPVILNGGDAGIDIFRNTGPIVFGASVAITSPSGIAFQSIDSEADITFNGSITKNNAGQLITVDLMNGGTISFNGPISTTTGAGVQFTAIAAPGTINFTGIAAIGDVEIMVSSGTFNFGSGVTVTSTNTSESAFGVNDDPVPTLSAPNITFSGTMTQTLDQPLVFIKNTSGGTIIFATSSILSATNGSGVQFDNADGTVNFNGSLTLNGGDAAIDVANGTAGTISFAANSSITNPSGPVFSISSSAPSSFIYSGTYTKNNNAVNGIVMQNNTGGSISLAGLSAPKILSTSTAAAVNLTNNTGTMINLGGGQLTISTTTGTGFNATGGGTVGVVGPNNTIASMGGMAVNIANTNTNTMGFRSITSDGAPSGVSLVNTGLAASLEVTGDGVTPGSGGSITNTTGDGVVLNNTTGVTIRRMSINNTAGHGVNATSVRHFEFRDTTMLNSGDADNEDALHFTDLTGTVFIVNSTFDGPEENGLSVQNSAGVLGMDIQGSHFTNAIRENGVRLFAFGTAVITTRISGGSFVGNETDGVNAVAQDTAQLNLIVASATFTGDAGSDNAIDILANAGSILRYQIGSANIISMLPQTAISIISRDTSNAQGSVGGNTIGTGVVDSGSVSGNGVLLLAEDSSTHVANVAGNNISNTQLEGILLTADDAVTFPSMHLGDVSNNTIAPPDGPGVNGMFIGALNRGSVCANISLNSATAGTGVGVFSAGIQVQQRDISSFTIEGLNGGSGTVNNPATVASYVQSQQNAGTTVSAQVATSFNGAGPFACNNPVPTPIP